MKDRAIPLLASIAVAACAAGHEAPSPEPVPLPTTSRQSPTIADSPIHLLRACVVQNGELTSVLFEYNVLTGDSVYQGVPFAQAFPSGPGYAETAEWFESGEVVRFGQGFRFVKYGVPRALDIRDVSRVGEYRGVGVYVEAGRDASAEIIYLPVRPGCIFQAYVPFAKME